MKERLHAYYWLAKPGIVYGNSITVVAGFLLASRGQVDLGQLLATLVGIALVIASACVVNNYIDRDIDALMSRTKWRALAKGTVSGRSAMVYAAVLGLAGVGILMLWVNALTWAVGLIAFIDYVILYGVAKRRSVHGTLVGSISGAAPIVAGYVAVTDRLDLGALLLFAILTLWQMPHFYAIAIYRLKDYQAAGIPVLPAKAGLHHTKVQIVAYIAAFILAALALTIFGYAGLTYAVVMAGVGLMWLYRGWLGFTAADDTRWARAIFKFSLVVLLVFSMMISVTALLP